MNNENKKENIKSCWLYFFSYSSLGVLCPLIGQYLSSIGFSGTQVGIITSLGTAMSVVSGIFWGKIYANASKQRWVIGGLFFGAAFFAIAGLATRDFYVYALIYSCVYFFQGPVHGFCDNLVIAGNENFPVIRSLGAVGYAVAVFAAGKYAEKSGLDKIFYMYAIAFIIAAIIILRKREPKSRENKERKVKIREVLKNRRYMQLLVCSFFVLGTNVGNSTYFGYLYREGGGTVAGIGLAFLLMAGSEAPFMFIIPYLRRKFSSQKLLLFSMVVCVLRFAFYGTGPTWQMLLFTFFLQGMSNGILLVEIVRYFGMIVEPELSDIAVSTYYAMGNSLSVIICSLIGGVLLDVVGAKGIYLFFAAWNSVAVALYISMGLHKQVAQNE